SKRDFLDVRDVVRAYRLLLEKGTPGEVYNLASNQPVSIRRMLDCLIALSGLSPTLETDPALYRPTDGCPDLDTSKLRKATGWKPAFSLDTTLADLFADAAKS
ncbi:MAG: GDP-mannose 4,6-dehydratase, partial [Kiritimatiellia bacterium]|nr:GDP-mannose 4,6-dehydratase [Kiritimatiellia bacterium]